MMQYCKKSADFYDSFNKVTFTIIENHLYECKDYLEFMSVKDDNGVYYLFGKLTFPNYFYSEKELRKVKLKKIYASCL
jgi:hypothetical protein